MASDAGESSDMSKKWTQADLNRWVHHEHCKRRRLDSLLLVSLLMVASGIVCESYLPSFVWQGRLFLAAGLWTAGVFILAAAVLLLTGRFRDNSASRTGCLLDRIHLSMSRLESHQELKDSSHPLRDAQAEDTMNCFIEPRRSNWLWWRNCCGVVILGAVVWHALLLCNYRVSSLQAQASLAAAIPSAIDRSKPSSAPAETPEPRQDDYAMLQITAPRPLLKASAWEAVPWEGEGDSTRGFHELCLVLSVNGDEPLRIPLNSDTRNPEGKLSLGGTLELDLLGVMPYDVMSYFLEGFTQIDDAPHQQVTSPIQFIQIKDVSKDNPTQANPETRYHADLMAFLHRQIGLIRGTYEVISVGHSIGAVEQTDALRFLADNQKQLLDDLKFFLDKAPEEFHVMGFWEHMLDAGLAMEAAWMHLKGDDSTGQPPQPRESGMDQQKAVTAIVQALKSDGKDKTGPQIPNSPWPFTEDNKLLVPPLPPEENPEMQLAALEQKQQQVVVTLTRDRPYEIQGDQTQSPTGAPSDRPGAEQEGQAKANSSSAAQGQSRQNGQGQGSASGTGKQQDEISRALQNLMAQMHSQPSMARQMDQAHRSSRQVEAQIDAKQWKDAGTSARKSRSDIQQALDQLRRDADQRAENSLQEVQKHLNDARQEANDGRDAQAGNSVGTAIAELVHQAKQQHASGRQSLAEKMASLARQIDRMQIPDSLEQDRTPRNSQATKAIDEAIAMVADVRMMDESAGSFLADAINRLGEVLQRIKENNADAAMSPEEMRDLRRQAQLAADDILQAAEKGNSGASGQNNQAEWYVRMDTLRNTIHLSHSQGSGLRILSTVIEPAAKELHCLGRQVLRRMETVEMVRSFSPEDVPAQYRQRVVEYFETLSTQAGAAQK
jgi:hypothetical protein